MGNKYYGQSASYGGTAQQEHIRTSAFNQQYLATYKKSFGMNNFDVLLGYESYDYRYEYSYATGQNLYKVLSVESITTLMKNTLPVLLTVATLLLVSILTNVGVTSGRPVSHGLSVKKHFWKIQNGLIC